MRSFRLLRRALDTDQETLIWEGDVPRWPESWSRDGRLLLFVEGLPTRAIGMLRLDDASSAQAWIESEFVKDEPHISSDGRWVAYQSDESGQFEVYLQAFPGPGQRFRVSSAGGGAPRWRADGGELFYLTPEGTIMTVALRFVRDEVQAGVPQALFKAPIGAVQLTVDQYDVTPDGQRFLVLKQAPEPGQPPLTVVVNWDSGLQDREAR